MFSSINGLGINGIYKILHENHISQKINGDLTQNRLNQIKYWVNKSIKENLINKFYNKKNIHREIEEIIENIKNKSANVEDLSKEIVNKYLK